MVREVLQLKAIASTGHLRGVCANACVCVASCVPFSGTSLPVGPSAACGMILPHVEGRFASQIEAVHRRLLPRFCAFGVRSQELSGGLLRLVVRGAAGRMISSEALVRCHLPPARASQKAVLGFLMRTLLARQSSSCCSSVNGQAGHLRKGHQGLREASPLRCRLKCIDVCPWDLPADLPEDGHIGCGRAHDLSGGACALSS